MGRWVRPYFSVRLTTQCSTLTASWYEVVVNVLVFLGFRNWGAGEPNGVDDKEACAELGWRTMPNIWNDAFCAVQRFWICEKVAGMEPLEGDLYPDGL